MKNQFRFLIIALIIVLPFSNFATYNLASYIIEKTDEETILGGIIAIFLFINIIVIGIICIINEILNNYSLSFLFPITIERANEIGLEWQKNDHDKDRSVWADKNGKLYLAKHLCFDFELNIRCAICGLHQKNHGRMFHAAVWREQGKYYNYSHEMYKKMKTQTDINFGSL